MYGRRHTRSRSKMWVIDENGVILVYYHDGSLSGSCMELGGEFRMHSRGMFVISLKQDLSWSEPLENLLNLISIPSVEEMAPLPLHFSPLPGWTEMGVKAFSFSTWNTSNLKIKKNCENWDVLEMFLYKVFLSDLYKLQWESFEQCYCF